MIQISHRGNVNGPTTHENNPEYIDTTLLMGLPCEVDVWYKNGWFLGHDHMKYQVNIHWLRNNSLRCWYHAKNLPALKRLLEDKDIKEVFWHKADQFTLTKGGFIWTYPGMKVTNKSIIVLEKQSDKAPIGCYGICSDYIKV
jgi:hypothetical protein